MMFTGGDGMGTVVNLKNQERCIICNEPEEKGIKICNQLICEKCQDELIETDVSDEKYQYFIKKLGKISLKIQEPKAAGQKLI